MREGERYTIESKWKQKKNSHFFLSFGAFDVRLLIHLQFRQRTAATHHCINGNRFEKGRGYTEFGKIFFAASLNYNVRIKWKRLPANATASTAKMATKTTNDDDNHHQKKGKTIKYFPRLFIFIIIRAKAARAQVEKENNAKKPAREVGGEYMCKR